MIKTLIGYDIEPGMSVEEYDRWLHDVHIPDILANPHVSRLVFNTVIRPVTRTSGGAASVGESLTFYRVAEMHFEDMAAYERYVAWFDEHPIPPERGPSGRTAFRFYLLADSFEATR
jgi:EthD domain